MTNEKQIKAISAIERALGKIVIDCVLKEVTDGK